MPARSYNRWERGGHLPSLNLLVKAADILQISLDELASRQEALSEPVIKNTELHQRRPGVDQLLDREQQAVIFMLDNLLRSTNGPALSNGASRHAAL